MRTALSRVTRFGVFGRSVVLCCAALLASACIAPIGWRIAGWVGLQAVGVAAAACLAGSVLALLAAEIFRAPGQALPRLLVGMTVRMAVPLAAALAISRLRTDWRQAGALYYLLVFYLVTLLVETVLLLPPAEVAKARTVMSPQSSPKA